MGARANQRFQRAEERTQRTRPDGTPVVDLAEAALLLGIDEETLREATKRGEIRGMQMGRQYRFAREVIERAASTFSRGLAYRDPVAAIERAVRSLAEHIDRLCQLSSRRSGYLYAIRQWDGGPIKIGKARDPVDRLVSIQRMNPHPLALLGLAHGEQAETAIHQRHHARRAHGEWFHLAENPLPVGDGACLVCAEEL